jgi:hypothetical protein
MAYEEKEFIKQKDGITAPSGFHYMPNGKLMSDAHHINTYGYIEKTLGGIDISTKDINYLGESRSFTVNGEAGSFFSLEIYDDSNNYYNFTTDAWSSTKTRLSRVKLDSSGYRGSITFPELGFVDATCDYNNDPTITHDDDNGAIEAGMLVTGDGIPDDATVSSVTSDTAFELSVSTTGGANTNSELRFSKLKTYTINLIAETVFNVKTKHSKSVESRHVDNSVNINGSKGSNSNILKNIIYQDVEKKLYLSCIAPSLYSTKNTFTTSGSTFGTDIVFTSAGLQVGDNIVFSGTTSDDWVLVTKVNPNGDNANEVRINKSISMSGGVVVTAKPAWNGVTPHSSNSTTGRDAISISSGQDISISFSINVIAPPGRALIATDQPTLEHLCAFTTIEFGAAALPILGEDTSSDTVFHRWPVNNVALLAEGMILDPSQVSGSNTTTPARISPYKTLVDTQEIFQDEYNYQARSSQIPGILIPGVDTGNNDASAIDRNGRLTAIPGNVIFNVQQLDALKDDNVRIFGYGSQISSITGMEVSLSNLNIEFTQVSTTTTAASSASTTIALTQVDDIVVGSEVRGVNINSAVANPTVTYKNKLNGAGNVTVSSAQTLEDGQTLFFDGPSGSAVITGTITVSNMAINSTSLYFDLEKFIDIV